MFNESTIFRERQSRPPPNKVVIFSRVVRDCAGCANSLWAICFYSSIWIGPAGVRWVCRPAVGHPDFRNHYSVRNIPEPSLPKHKDSGFSKLFDISCCCIQRYLCKFCPFLRSEFSDITICGLLTAGNAVNYPQEDQNCSPNGRTQLFSMLCLP